METLVVVLYLLERDGVASAVNAAPANVQQGALKFVQTDLQRRLIREPGCQSPVLCAGLPELPPPLLMRG